jgi:hypothetical protein
VVRRLLVVCIEVRWTVAWTEGEGSRTVSVSADDFPVLMAVVTALTSVV